VRMTVRVEYLNRHWVLLSDSQHRSMEWEEEIRGKNGGYLS
jgi:hypothetical protein